MLGFIVCDHMYILIHFVRSNLISIYSLKKSHYILIEICKRGKGAQNAKIKPNM